MEGASGSGSANLERGLAHAQTRQTTYQNKILLILADSFRGHAGWLGLVSVPFRETSHDLLPA